MKTEFQHENTKLVLNDELSDVDMPINSATELTQNIPIHNNDNSASSSLIEWMNKHRLLFNYPFSSKKILINDFFQLMDSRYANSIGNMYSSGICKIITDAKINKTKNCFYISENCSRISVNYKNNEKILFNILTNLNDRQFSEVTTGSTYGGEEGTKFYDAVGFNDEFKNVFMGLKSTTELSKQEISELLCNEATCVRYDRIDFSAIFQFQVEANTISIN